jgi:hypothetical protein
MNAVLEPCARIAVQARFQFFPGATESQVAQLQSSLHQALSPALEIVELYLREQSVGRGSKEKMRFAMFFRKGAHGFPDQQVNVYTVSDYIGGRSNRRMSVVYSLYDADLIFDIEDQLKGFAVSTSSLPSRDLPHRLHFCDWMEELILPGAIFLPPFARR